MRLRKEPIPERLLHTNRRETPMLIAIVVLCMLLGIPLGYGFARVTAYVSGTKW